ncbi:MAG: ATP-binding protein [Candidatus Nitricoxidivorans perseverans]|uniref:histidine kinase n=1 Tax=Candidatus Nitricoxidivorans perseverans TaxID=2975601 RepID=A0AA49FNR6_9PROT|nr:MAG: ATP-binding protein [Candidatus Nitricoxidivorans perseverans]
MPSSLPAGDGSSLRLALRRLVALRWWLLAGATVAVLAMPPMLVIPLPAIPMLAVAALMAGFNVLAHRRVRGGEPVSPAEFFGQLCVDLAALAALLFLSGGAANPVISLLLVPVAVAALSLSGGFVAATAALAVALYSLLMWHFVPLAIADAGRATRLHLAGMWLTFVVSAIMIAWFVVRMTAAVRERDTRLAEVREQALRDERVVALGTLAAGAAHELGTPLATMSVIVEELERGLHGGGLDTEAHADLAILRQQISACKGIITGLSERAGVGRGEGARPARADLWLLALRDRWHVLRPHARSRLEMAGPQPAPVVIVETTLEQGLLNLFNNAANAGRGEVSISGEWDGRHLFIEVHDDGPGFPADVLERAGREPLPAHAGGSGIGLFLAHAAIDRMGGRLTLGNPPEGGGLARVELPLAEGATI